MRDRKGIVCSVTLNIETELGLSAHTIFRSRAWALSCFFFLKRCCSIAGKLRWIFMEIPDPLGVEGFGLIVWLRAQI